MLSDRLSVVATELRNCIGRTGRGRSQGRLLQVVYSNKGKGVLQIKVSWSAGLLSGQDNRFPARKVKASRSLPSKRRASRPLAEVRQLGSRAHRGAGGNARAALAKVANGGETAGSIFTRGQRFLEAPWR